VGSVQGGAPLVNTPAGTHTGRVNAAELDGRR